MSSLREIKDRIGSVRSTLKITNAMKLVSSAKLRKAQQAIEALRPYEATLSAILAEVSCSEGVVLSGERRQKGAKMQHPPDFSEGGASKWGENASAPQRVAVVAVASNSSLCGSFNGNVLRKTLEVLRSIAGEATASDPVRGSAAPVLFGGFSPFSAEDPLAVGCTPQESLAALKEKLKGLLPGVPEKALQMLLR